MFWPIGLVKIHNGEEGMAAETGMRQLLPCIQPQETENEGQGSAHFLLFIQSSSQSI